MKRLTQDRTKDGKTDVWGSMTDIAWERLQVHVNSWGAHFVDPNDPTKSRMADPAALEGLENDPRALGQMMKRMGNEMGEDLPPEFDDVVDRLEAGQSVDPKHLDAGEHAGGEAGGEHP